jgi:rubrerythrin
MTDKRLRAIAALEVEVEMTEAHVKRLSTVAHNLAHPEQQHAMAALVKEENDRAELLRRQIHLLRGHV